MGGIIKYGLPFAPSYGVWGYVDAGTVTSSDLKTFTDSTKAWAVDEHVGRLVEIDTGTGNGQTRLIKSNTADTITINTDAADTYWDLRFALDITSTFKIMFNWEDVYQADVAAGWGKITKLGNRQYYLSEKFYVGISGYDPAWFGTANENVEIASGKNLGIGYNSRYRQGEILDATKKITANGTPHACTNFFTCLTGVNAPHSVYIASSYLFSYGLGVAQGLPEGSRVWNCTTNGIYFSVGGLTDFYNVVTHPSTAMLVYAMPITADKILMISPFKGFVPYEYKDLQVSNTEFIDEVFTLHDTFNKMYGDVFFTDVIAKWHLFINPADGMDQGKLWRQYTMNLKLTDSNGANIDGASVTLQNSDGKLSSTEASGSLLTADIDNVQTSITVTDGTDFTISDVIRIDAEYMQVTNIVANTLTVSRNYYGAGYFAILHYENRIIYKVTGAVSVAGVVPKMVVIDGYFNKATGDTIVSYGPVILTIKHYNHTTYTARMDIVAPINQTLTLFDDPWITKNETQAGIIGGICNP